MFGQSMATFVPPMLAGTVVFSHGYSPAEILRQIRSRRVSVLVCVPKVLDVLREHVSGCCRITAEPDTLAGKHFLRRWWHYRDVHRLFGWKFWCIVCGAAPLDPELEAFWRKLGFLVVQGYGLTETAPIVTLNHPFRASTGTVGTPIGGVEVKIAPDGEILVRGDNVTSGYYQAPGRRTSAASRARHSRRGVHGRLVPHRRHRRAGRGRPAADQGPQEGNDRHAAGPERLSGRRRARAAGAAGRHATPASSACRVDGEERIHAVLVRRAAARTSRRSSAAPTRTLEDHQRVWSTSVWPGTELPRTEGTQKLKRRELQRWASGGRERERRVVGRRRDRRRRRRALRRGSRR